MLKDGLLARVFIRTSILSLRSIAPLSITYCVCRGFGLVGHSKTTLIRVIDVYAITESLFFLVVYLPRKWLLNRPAAPSTVLATREEREAAFVRTWGAYSDPHEYLSGWFKGVAVEELQREDIKDFISWRLWNSTQRAPEYEDELDHYLAMVEDSLHFKLPLGSSGKTSMAVTLEPLQTVHRPLLWYLVRRPDLKFPSRKSLTDPSYLSAAQTHNSRRSCAGMVFSTTHPRSAFLS
jgi:hypothetical protein